MILGKKRGALLSIIDRVKLLSFLLRNTGALSVCLVEDVSCLH